MMQRYDALPAEAREESHPIHFLILGKGLKVLSNEISEGKECERNSKREEAMSLIGLQRECNGRSDVRNVNRKQKLPRAAVDKAEGRNGIGEDYG